MLARQRQAIILERVREEGAVRVADLVRELGVSDMTIRRDLEILHDQGVLEKVPYQEPSSRQRWAYELTPAGRDLQVVLGAMQGWGDRHIPRPEGPSVERRTVDGRVLSDHPPIELSVG